jgi:uncharacterized protein
MIFASPAYEKFYLTFSSGRVVLPVIHVSDYEQAHRNVQISFDSGSDGVFLINHLIPYAHLLDICKQIRNDFPYRWIGINCLDLKSREVFSKITTEVDGIWTDNAGIREELDEQVEADEINDSRINSEFNGLYFGGVAFKYQRYVFDIETVTALASKYVDVVTTSGPRTGQPAEISKIKKMKKVLGDHPLAIASGISKDNVQLYLPYVDCFLVATGISKSFTELDPVLLTGLIIKVKQFNTDAE